MDLRFIEIGYEFSVLCRTVCLLEEHFPEVVRVEIDRLRESVDPEDEGSLQEFERRRHELQRGVTTRSVTAAPIVAAWGAYESAIIQLARSVQRCRRLALSLSDLRGSFLDRARKYFPYILGLDLHPTTTDWSRIEAIATLRHCFAHANGRTSDLSVEVLNRIESIVAATPELRLEEEYLIVTFPFVKASVVFLDELLAELVQRLKQEFPDARDPA